MPHLFEVPGWSVDVPTEPLPSSSSKKSKKRKRPHDNDAPSEKLESAQVNLEKLMGTIEWIDPVKRPPKKRHKGKRATGSSEGVPDNTSAAATRSKASPDGLKSKDMRKPSNKPKGTQKIPKEKGRSQLQHLPKVVDSVDPDLTKLQNQMKKKLDGARFR